ncbi:MAG: GYD domain-containing protein [Dehalococcoidia bacterium]|nr:MAG: GYD domain-containing protein [Dehalococcoidia bacterium]
MTTYIILSRVHPEVLKEPKEFKQLTERVSKKILNDCPDVVWKESFGTLGRFDIVDIIESDDPKQIAKAAMILSTMGHETTETLTAIPWKEFLVNY